MPVQFFKRLTHQIMNFRHFPVVRVIRSKYQRLLQRSHGLLQVPSIETGPAQSKKGVGIISACGGGQFEPLFGLARLLFLFRNHAQVILAVIVIGSFRKFGKKLFAGFRIVLGTL